MKKHKLFILFSFLFLFSSLIYINASEKRNMPYEINDVKIDGSQQYLEISGWAFLSDVQNFKSANTHGYKLILSASDHRIEVDAKLLGISHTETMRYTGSRWCADNEFNKNSTECNNYYDNIGFVFSVPLKDIKMDRNYKAQLSVYAKQANISKTLPIYFPVSSNIVLNKGKNHYIIDSKLNDLSLKVIFKQVLARDNAGKTGNIRLSKLNCSNNNKVYYREGAVFNKIFDKKMLNNTTYYKLSAKELGCNGPLAEIGEGSQINPVWIASNFVDYHGEQLTIKTRFINKPPIISIKYHPTIYHDEEIDIMAGVSAYDNEDGDLTSKIKIESNNFKSISGSYVVKFSVSDSDGLIAYNSKYISVVKRNFPPVIKAKDREVYQYSKFDPYTGVSAFDQDLNNITNKVKTTTTVNTSVVGKQIQCYTVSDQSNLKTNHCVNVNVIKLKTKFRFVSINNLFYNEPTPIIWSDKMERLKIEINNDLPYISKNISK